MSSSVAPARIAPVVTATLCLFGGGGGVFPLVSVGFNKPHWEEEVGEFLDERMARKWDKQVLHRFTAAGALLLPPNYYFRGPPIASQRRLYRGSSFLYLEQRGCFMGVDPPKLVHGDPLFSLALEVHHLC